MFISLAVVFTLLCWIFALFFFLNMSISEPQYGSNRNKVKHRIYLILSTVMLVLVLPSLGFYLAW